MIEVNISDATRHAEMVRHSDELALFVVWRGGTTFNIYTTGPDGEPPIHEVDVFSVCDDNGEPVPRDTAEEHMLEYIERLTAAH
jgi:hypothetical protein